MLEIIGFLSLLIPLIWLSIFVFFITVPTFGSAMFNEEWYKKILGFILWLLLIWLWLKWLSYISIDIG